MSLGLGVLWGVGRLAEGVDSESARVELDELNRRLDHEHFGTNMEVAMRMRPIVEEHLGSGTSAALLWLLASVALLLLIACANVAGLGVTRALSRSDEVRIQRALGATPSALFGEVFAESFLVAGTGCLLGVSIAAGLLKVLPLFGPPQWPNPERVELNGTVLVFAVAAAFAATFVSALAAAATWRRSHRGRVRDALVVAEVGLAMVLSTGAGLCYRSFGELRKIELGYRADHVLTALFLYPESEYPELEDRRALVSSLLARVRALPGVTSAATVLLRPFEAESAGWTSYLVLEGESVKDDSFTRHPDVNFEAVSPDYFRTMGIRLFEGRDFTEQDTDDAPRVAIITRDLARRLWPGEPALGKQLMASYGSRTRDENGEPRFQTIVGIVEEANYRGLMSHFFDLYVPYRQSNPQPNQFVIRTSMEPESLPPSSATRSGRRAPPLPSME
jgi:putative ABC transport system permease protein